MSRSSSDKQRHSLKMAVARVIDLIGAGNLAETVTRVNATMLSRYIAPHEDDRHAGIDVVLDLEIAAGDPAVTRTLAALQGYDLVKAEQKGTGQNLDLDDLQRLHREASEAVSAIMAGIADQTITPSAKKRILNELADLRQAIAAIEAKVEAA
ncbi:hypothetical protein NKJ13_08060 [Mesorhizobium sp. M0174]|uniref:hypothetical protein n=1 Tax=Mesorhizobium sp. M0174 TaxID=2956904 RepID=UPI0033380E33